MGLMMTKKQFSLEDKSLDMLMIIFLMIIDKALKILKCKNNFDNLKLLASDKYLTFVLFILGRETKSHFSLLLSDSKLLVLLTTLIKPLHTV